MEGMELDDVQVSREICMCMKKRNGGDWYMLLLITRFLYALSDCIRHVAWLAGKIPYIYIPLCWSYQIPTVTIIIIIIIIIIIMIIILPHDMLLPLIL